MKNLPRVPNTRLKITEDLIARFKDPGRFVIFSGDSGSGRTGVLEAVISELDARYQVLFVPCTGDESLQDLRKLFLMQLLPDSKWDLGVNLADTLHKLPIPGRRRILVVADDIDKVQSGFFEELKALYEQTLGGGRFAFLVTSHPLWAQKVQKIPSRGSVEELAMPPLTTAESLSLVESYFKAAGLEREFNSISPNLPEYLEACKGNISKVIKQTELLMDDPKLAQSGRPPENEAQLRAATKKKHGSAGIFITVVCLAIAAACLVPLFMGGSLFGSDEEELKERIADAENQSSLVIPKDEDDAKQDPLTRAGITDEDTKKAIETSSDPLRQGRGTNPDLRASSDHGTADEAKLDDGGLLPDIQDGLEANTPNSDSKNSVVLKGKTLDAIEKSEAGSGNDPDLPRPGVGGSVNNENTEKADDKTDTNTSSDVVVLKRENNILHADEIKAEDEEIAKAKAEEVRKLAELKSKQEAEAKAKEEALKKAADAKARALDDEKAKAAASAKSKKESSSQKVASSRVQPRGDGIPGASSELKSKDPKHYALQVIAGRNRSSVVEASGAVSGRYWIYETTRERKPWFVLVTGDYASASEAMSHVKDLPASLRAGGPFSKSFSRIQLEMGLAPSNGQ